MSTPHPTPHPTSPALCRYTIQTGGMYGPSEVVQTPFVAGHDGVAVVVKVGGWGPLALWAWGAV